MCPEIKQSREREGDIMRRIQRSVAGRAVVALLVGGALTYLVWLAGSVFMVALLFALLVVISFVLLTIAPDAIAQWRGHEWRWWWRSPGDDGPFWAGTRIPRHPRPPLLPSRGATATFDDSPPR